MKKIIFLILFFSFNFFSCDNDTLSYFPYMEVSFKVSLNPGDPKNTLSDINGYYMKTIIEGADKIGYGGVLVYHTIDDAFTAYDLVCPNEVERGKKISSPNAEGIVKCSHCGSTFDIRFATSYGRPLSGPALERERRLQYYPANRSGNYVIVSNR